MATTRTATHWEGNLSEGKGTVSLSSSTIGTYDVSWPARSEKPGVSDCGRGRQQNCPVSKALSGVPEITLDAQSV